MSTEDFFNFIISCPDIMSETVNGRETLGLMVPWC
jgi:hypothetical protein